MCGIAGFWQTRPILERSHLELMGKALMHRGPDYTGYYIDDAAGMVHNRLSIIDLNSRANQPVFSHNKRFVMAYNGEVYNFNELASQFAIETHTTGDSEVVLELFVKKGVDFVNYLNGMFAIAIYDTVEKRIFLFRDRVGIKPLYYYFDDTIFAFASELKALQKALPDKLYLKHEAIARFLHLGFIPAPLSIYENVKKVQPGEIVIIDQNGLNHKRWWHIEDHISDKKVTNEKDALLRLDKLVNNAVQRRLISDVPVGTFLSGGIDSSLVSAVAARHFPGQIKTFTIGFEHAAHDEAGYAAQIARHIGSDHRQYYVTEKEARELLPAIITQYDEPFGDTSAIPTMLVSQIARQEVKVTLSGDGGDELFMGYGSHIWAKRLQNPKHQNLSPLYRAFLKYGNNRHKRAAKLFEKAVNIPAHIFSQEQYFFSNQELSKLLKSGYKPFNPAFTHLSSKLTAAEKQALFDFTYYLPDDLLTKVDRASMRYALETRVPLLDHSIVETAFQLNETLRLHGKTGKYLLKKLLSGYVPPAFFDRPKQGFSVPLTQWMKGPLKEWFETYLDEQTIKKHNLINHEYVNHLRKAFESPRHAYLYNRLWAVAALHAWLEKYN